MTNHYGKEAFITALSRPNGNHAIKVEAHEQSMVCQGTLASDHDKSRAKRQSRNVYAVSDQSDPGENITLQKRIDELQEMFEQAANCIAALAAYSGAAAKGYSARDSDAKKSASDRGNRSRRAGRGKFGRWQAPIKTLWSTCAEMLYR